MPERSVDRVWTGRGRTVNFAGMAFPSPGSDVYDAATMRLCSPPLTALFSTALVLFVPLGAQSADGPAASPVMTLVAIPAVGAEAVTITGNAPAAYPVEAKLYAKFSRDLPTVYLSRRSVPTDANGHYNVTLPIASAFFRNAIVTVVVQSLPAGPSARASIIVSAPNFPAPPDDIPPSVR
jgi:hypothetical protein